MTGGGLKGWRGFTFCGPKSGMGGKRGNDPWAGNRAKKKGTEGPKQRK